MTTAHGYQHPRQTKRRRKAAEAGEMAQQLASMVSGLDTPRQQEIAAQKLGPFLAELREELNDDAIKAAHDRLYGPFYTTERTMRRLGLENRQALTGRVGRNTILRVKTADGRNAYPELQFESADVLPTLKPVLQLMLPHVATEWTVLDWLVHPHPELHSRRPIDSLRSGDAEPVLAAARADASAWAA